LSVAAACWPKFAKDSTATVIDQAKGILMALRQISADSAPSVISVVGFWPSAAG